MGRFIGLPSVKKPKLYRLIFTLKPFKSYVTLPLPMYILTRSSCDWALAFPLSYGLFGEPDFSDHSSSCIILDPEIKRLKKPFKFYNMVLKHQDFLPLIQESWYSISAVGSDMFRVSFKLNCLKKVIRDFSKENYSDLEKRVVEAHEKVVELQSSLLANPTQVVAMQEIEAHRLWQILVQAEESFFCQRSRVCWLKEGDKNTSYFHRMTKSRQSINHIHFLMDENGAQIDSQEAIQDHCVKYFQNLLGSPVEPSMFTQEDITALLNYSCSDSTATALDMNFSKEEIRAAFFSLPRNKCSGPDGYSSEFFIACWSVVGVEVTLAVAEFFASGKLLKQWNATTIVLIPKTENAASTKDFRPISLLNTVYKVISKLLAGRLQKLLPNFICHSQTAFLPGRLLSENVLLATAIIQGYGRKNNEPKAMLKVDIRKAFDSVNWDFIIAILKGMGIPSKFINWIFECISTATFSVLVNGVSAGFFKSTKGLRQGDPLSPYLFVLAMEVFSRLLKPRYQSGLICYHPRTEELGITHLMFADDVMVFFDGSTNSLHGITETLDDFASWSGLQMNQEKTELFHSGLTLAESTSIARYGFPIGSLPIKYLGLPLMSRKLRINEYAPLLHKIVGRFKSWAVMSLSFAGRAQLIASVIAGTVNFWIQTFMLPKGCIKKIESLCARFLWSGNIEKPKVEKVAWSTVCLPKEEGGLGLRSFSAWNATLCLRLIWLLFSDSASLWVAWQRHHHLRDCNFWALKGKPSDPWNWKSLLKLRHLAIRFLHCDVGKGTKASFWFDVWTPFGPLINYIGDEGPRMLRIPLSASVSAACNERGWIIPHARSEQTVNLQVFLTNISLPSSSTTEDIYGWYIDGIKCRGFSSAKTWSVLRPSDAKKDWSNVVWFKGSTPKHAFLMWITQLDRLPTRMRLVSWGMAIPKSCCLCNVNDETRHHLLLTCSFAAEIWLCAKRRLGMRPSVFPSWSALISWAKASTKRAPSTVRKTVTQAVIYGIWKQRNNLLHNHQTIPLRLSSEKWIVMFATQSQLKETSGSSQI